MMLTWKYSLPAFLVPFAFTLDPRGLGLLLASTWTDAVLTTVTAAIGVAGLAMGFGGWAIGRRSMTARTIAVVGGLLLFHPAPIADVAGLAGIALAFVVARRATA
jgi:TRAP-type uncharacterized transport system fused permease subunit